MAYLLNLILDQGSTYSNTVVLSQNNDPVSWANTTVTASFRDFYDDANTVYSFITTLNNTNPLGVTLNLAANVSANLEAGIYVWDMVMTNNNVITRLREGYLTINSGVTDIVPPVEGSNVSTQYNLLTISWGSISGTFILGEQVYQALNSTANGFVALVTNITANNIAVEDAIGSVNTSLVLTGNISNVVANTLTVEYT